MGKVDEARTLVGLGSERGGGRGQASKGGRILGLD